MTNVTAGSSSIKKADSRCDKTSRGKTSSYQSAKVTPKDSFFRYHSLTMADNEVEDDGLWEKPAWAKPGHKLKATGKATQMKTKGDLAAPITNIRDDKDAMKKIKQTQGAGN